MKKMNKKGFTLIELLAVIVILAIIMVIAVPQILNVIDNSKKKAWSSTVGLIKEAIELNTSLASTGMAEGDFESIECACTPSSVSNPTCNEANRSKTTNDIISSIADYDDASVTCSSNVFTIQGSGQFVNKTASLTCSASGCELTSITGNQ